MRRLLDIYNCIGLINMMRRFMGQRNLLRLAKTRFATLFLTLSNIHKQNENLRNMFTFEDWTGRNGKKGGPNSSNAYILEHYCL